MSAIERGAVIGIGATNLRGAIIDGSGAPGPIHKVRTPGTPELFFGKTADLFVDAYDDGATWGVMGAPGPASVEFGIDDWDTHYLSVTNIPALKPGFDPVIEMASVNQRFAEMVYEKGFKYLTVNDAYLASQAGAKLYGTTPDRTYNTVGAIVVGTGVGGHIVHRDKQYPNLNLFHANPGHWEIGHNVLDIAYPSLTIESIISGTALERRTGKPAEELDRTDPVWLEVAQGIGGQILNLGINGGAELVVISGSNGIHGYYLRDMKRLLKQYKESRNPMADMVPDVKIVPRRPRRFTDEFELHGAKGAMNSHLYNKELSRLAIGMDIGGTIIK